jgi:hypothetical protein
LAIGKHAEGCKKSEKFREKKWKKSMLTWGALSRQFIHKLASKVFLKNCTTLKNLFIKVKCRIHRKINAWLWDKVSFFFKPCAISWNQNTWLFI